MAAVLSESLAGQSRQDVRASVFWWRLTDNLFRRLVLFLLPVVAMTMLGFLQASKTVPLYHAAGTLSTSTNPLIPDQGLNGVNPQFWESPAAALSRRLNERLGTNNFLSAV